MTVTHYICDRCGAEVKPVPGQYTLFGVDFHTGKQDKDGRPVIERAEECPTCFVATKAEAMKAKTARLP